MQRFGSTSVFVPEGKGALISGAFGVFRSWFTRRDLLMAQTRREVLSKYQGSFLGLLWSVITPLLRLAIYTLVFSVILKIRWTPEGERMGEFAIMLFCGLIPYTFFQEVLGQAPTLITRSPNFVKKVAFPVEMFSLVSVSASLVHTVISFVVLMGGVLIIFRELPWTFLWLPLLFVPLVLTTLALSLVSAALGVFVRDLSHVVEIVLQLLFFLTPIIYPASMVPAKLKVLVDLNPIAFVAINVRQTMIHGQAPDWSGLFLFTLGGTVLLFLAAGWFQVIRGRFSDVL